MGEKSQQARAEAAERNAAFEESYVQGDTVGAAFEAMDAMDAERRADELLRAEHPELELIQLTNTRLKQIGESLSLCAYGLAVIVILLCVIAYKL